MGNKNIITLGLVLAITPLFVGFVASRQYFDLIDKRREIDNEIRFLFVSSYLISIVGIFLIFWGFLPSKDVNTILQPPRFYTEFYWIGVSLAIFAVFFVVIGYSIDGIIDIDARTIYDGRAYFLSSIFFLLIGTTVSGFAYSNNLNSSQRMKQLIIAGKM